MKELKIRLLDNITDWLIDIQKNSLEVNIPLTKELDADFRYREEIDALFRYSIERCDGV